MIFSSCQEKRESLENKVTLKIVNKELNYLESRIDSLDFSLGYNHYNINTLFKARNNVVFEIKNNSEDNLLFLMNPYKLFVIPDTGLPNKENFTNGELRILITTHTGSKISTSLGDFSPREEETWKIILKEKEIKGLKEKLKEKLGHEYQYDDIIQNSFVIKSKEAAIFSVKLDLPFINQPFIENNFNGKYYFLSNETYNFQIYYSLSSKNRDLLINPKTVEKLEQMNIKVFEGTLNSNIIKIKPLNE